MVIHLKKQRVGIKIQTDMIYNWGKKCSIKKIIGRKNWHRYPVASPVLAHTIGCPLMKHAMRTSPKETSSTMTKASTVKSPAF